MEVVLSEDLFPDCLSVMERTKHWVAFFSFFTPHHIKALNSILFQKQRYSTYLMFKWINTLGFFLNKVYFVQVAGGNVTIFISSREREGI